MEEKRKYNEDDILALSAEEYFQTYLFDAEGENLIMIIVGFLREFGANLGCNSQHIEKFSDYEKDKAPILKNLCELYLSSVGAKSDVELIQNSESVTTVQSKKVCRVLKKHFKKYDRRDRGIELREDGELFTASRERGNCFSTRDLNQYSFILGVVLRRKSTYHDGLAFAGNGSRKQVITVEFLLQFNAFGGKKMTVEYAPSHVPGGTTIHLLEDNPIWKAAKKFITKHRLDEED